MGAISPGLAAEFTVRPGLPAAFQSADIVILGEVHDNALHHGVQAMLTAELKPTALVFEMFGPEAAEALSTIEDRSSSSMAEALGWSKLGWPDFALYYPIFHVAQGAAVLGAALPSDVVRQAVTDGAAAMLDGDAARFGLDAPLPAAEQADRLALQDVAHCNALPAELLPGMVEAQRLRDAAFAQTALEALAQFGAPVVVIAGTGHARRDWGIPAALARAAPQIKVATLGQGETGGSVVPDDRFDLYITAPPAERPDPCDAFR